MAIVTYLELRLLNMLSWHKNKSGILTFIFICFGISINLYFLNRLMETTNDPLNNPDLVSGVLIGVFLTTFFRVFIPSYTPFQDIIPAYLPISKIKRILFNWWVELFFNIYFLVGIVLLCCLRFGFKYEAINSIFVVKYVTVIIIAILLRRLLQIHLERELKNNYKIINLIVILSGILLIYLDIYYFQYWLLNILLLLFFPLACFIIEGKSSFSNKSHTIIGIGSVPITILRRNQIAFASLIVSLAIKAFILFVVSYSYQVKSKYPPYFIIYLFLLPTSLFTYVFNNTWGILKSLWFNVDLATGNGNVLFHILGRIFLYPLLIDILITTIFLIGNPIFILEGVLGYSVSLILFFVFSFYWSLVFVIPQKSKWSITVTNTTSVPTSIITVLFAAVLSLVHLNSYFRVLYILFLLVAFSLLYHSKKFYLKERKNMLSSLFKNENI